MIDVHSLIRQNRSTVGRVLFLSIDGHGGSGKSTLANDLGRLLHSEIVRTDDFASFDYPRDWWRDLLREVLLPVESGARTLNYERTTWWPGQKSERIRNQIVTDQLILEGVGSSRTEFRKYLGLSIFVETPREICISRGVARDLEANVGTEKDILRNWEQWISEEWIYFERDDPRSYADVVIDGLVPFEEQILGLS